MKILWIIFAWLLMMTTQAMAASLPYDEKADAKEDVSRAIAQARENRKNVLIVFGANWCPDCRRLDHTIYEEDGKLGKKNYNIVKVDVGNFDKNIDLAKSYGNPIRKGIPGATILTPDSKTLYAGPLSYLVEPHRRLKKLAIYGITLLGGIFALLGSLMLIRRKFFSKQLTNKTAR